MCGTGNTETETAISKTVLGLERERERDPKQFLETVSMVTNRCRSKYISSLSPLGQQQQNATKTIQAGVMTMTMMSECSSSSRSSTAAALCCPSNCKGAGGNWWVCCCPSRSLLELLHLMQADNNPFLLFLLLMAQ